VNIFRRIVSAFTCEKHIYEFHGDYWVSCLPYDKDVLKYPFHYRKVSQKWYGVWVEENEWLSKWTPLRLKVMYG